MLEEVGEKLDPARTHFLGKVAYGDYKRVLQLSAAHLYLTYPFVLSWSMLEAMATGYVVVGSDIAPVSEVIEDGVNGLLVGIFDVEQLVSRTVETLEMAPHQRGRLTQAAKQRASVSGIGKGTSALEALCAGECTAERKRA